MGLTLKSILISCLIAGSLSCSSSDSVTLNFNTVIPVRSKAPINLSKTLSTLMSVSPGIDCYQNQILLAVYDPVEKKIIASKKVKLRTDLANLISYTGDPVAIDTVITHLTNYSNFDEPLSIAVPRGGIYEIGLIGSVYKPTDVLRDGICDEESALGPLESSSLIGKAQVNTNNLISGPIPLKINVLHTNPSTNYILTAPKHRDWTELDYGFGVTGGSARLKTVHYLGQGEPRLLKANVDISNLGILNYYLPDVIFPAIVEFKYSGSSVGCLTAGSCSGNYQAVIQSGTNTITANRTAILTGNPPTSITGIYTARTFEVAPSSLPIMTVNLPNPNVWIGSTTAASVGFSGTCTESNQALVDNQPITIKLDGIPVTTTPAVITCTPITGIYSGAFNISSASYSQGPHTLTAHITDTNSNSGSSSPITINKDTVSPTIAITGPNLPNGKTAVKLGDTVTFTLAINDLNPTNSMTSAALGSYLGLSGTTGCTLAVTGSGPFTISVSGCTGNEAIKLTVGTIGGGDLAGNTTLAISSSMFTVDNTPPIAASPMAWTGSSPNFIANWAPSADAVKQTFQLYTGTNCSGGPSGFAVNFVGNTTTSHTPTGLSPNTYYFKIKSTDGAGNESWSSCSLGQFYN
jgi:hypothetical protein